MSDVSLPFNADPLSANDSIGRLLRRIERADVLAVNELRRRSFEKIVGIFRHWYGHRARPACDEEDLASELFTALWQRIRDGKLVDIHFKDQFWRSVNASAHFKILSRRNADRRQKRGGGNVPATNAWILAAIPSAEPAAEAVVAFREELARLLALLSDDRSRQIACLRIEGCSVSEIAIQVGTSQSTVARSLRRTRGCWRPELLVPPPPSRPPPGARSDE